MLTQDHQDSNFHIQIMLRMIKKMRQTEHLCGLLVVVLRKDFFVWIVFIVEYRFYLLELPSLHFCLESLFCTLT